jgi:septal ring-binding cell division protein DamX
MQVKLPGLILGMAVIGLSSCMEVDNQPDSYGYTTYTYGSPMMMQGSYVGSDVSYESESSKTEVEVPDSYYVAPSRTPVSFKDKDRQWVSSQNPKGYTVEVADDEKASKVAGRLYQLPKNDRMAQIKYQRNGKGYYKGIYGSYESQEAAQKAMDALPADMKVGASVKDWGSVQGNMTE